MSKQKQPQLADIEPMDTPPKIDLSNLNLPPCILKPCLKIFRSGSFGLPGGGWVPTVIWLDLAYQFVSHNRSKKPIPVSQPAAHFEATKAEHKHPFYFVSEKDLHAGFFKWSEGYKKGYQNFDKNLRDSLVFSDQKVIAQKIFDRATGNLFAPVEFPVLYEFGSGLLDSWAEAGFNAGEFYRSWEIITSEYSHFVELFRAKYGDDPTDSRMSTDGSLAQNDRVDLRIIALAEIYKGNHLNEKNAVQTAQAYNTEIKNPMKLLQYYSYYGTSKGKEPKDATVAKVTNEINRLEKVKRFIDESLHEKVQKDIEKLISVKKGLI